MEAAAKHPGRSGTGPLGAILLAIVLFIALPGAARAANWGSDVYGGGAYNVGVVPAPAHAPAPTGGGGPAPSGPLSVGYVAPPPAATTAAAIATATATTTLASAPIATTTAMGPATASGSPFQFMRSLQFRDHDADVKRLQQFLNSHSSTIAADGAGSPGQETDYFGILTLRALTRFQDAHADEILKPVGLSSGSGYFGPATRAFIDALSN